MFEPEEAARFEARLSDNNKKALLEGGSSYTNIFTGGASESHFCPSSMGWGPALRMANPFVLLVFLVTNFYSFLRVVVLMLIELGLSLVDFVRGIFGGYEFIKELKFIPTRVAIAILLRELSVIGGKIDITRGLPVIHINFLGYDEQSHRRGPHSLFAHWTLKGIDDAISRLWGAANHSPWRHYDVWIFSDHGQAAARPYPQVQGYSLEEAVSTALKKLGATTTTVHPDAAKGIQTQRVRFLGGKKIQRLLSVLGINGDEIEERRSVVAALGSVGHIYLPADLTEEECDFIARELAQTHKVPLVLRVTSTTSVRADTDEGEYRLPQDQAALFGSKHPFLDSLADDLSQLCRHADAGDLVVLGWREGISPMSFAVENGAHGGISPEEPHGFALLPHDAPLQDREHDYLRPGDLRKAALRHLEQTNHHHFVSRSRPAADETETLRVMTYNVHSCVGMDGKLDAKRIARVIARARPDVVALQELDVGRVRTSSLDQAHLISRYLNMDFHFHPAIHVEEERYGDAILTHLPHRLIKTSILPGLSGKPYLEPRGALWVAIDLHGREVQVINTHLGLDQRERAAQVEALLGDEWLANENCHDPVIVCGDFNALPSSTVCRQLGKQLRDVQNEARNYTPQNTFPTRFPTLRIDHIFTSPELQITGIEVPNSQIARTASDHLPLVAEIRICDKEKKCRSI
ncbi:MAG: endonuclease/exonuclease/phosphatase family protein [Pseudomonadota bacterium]